MAGLSSHVLAATMLQPAPLLRPATSLAVAAAGRHSLVTMAVDDEELVDGYFGINSLVRTCQFVTLWWALWSLYDFYLTPYSPVPELTILGGTTAFTLNEERRARDEARRPGGAGVTAVNASVATLPTPWPCTTEGCSMED